MPGCTLSSGSERRFGGWWEELARGVVAGESHRTPIPSEKSKDSRRLVERWTHWVRAGGAVFGVLALCGPAFAGPVLGSSCSESCRGGFRCVQLGHVCWCIEEMASCRASAGPSPDQSDTVSLCGLPWPPGGSSVVVMVLCACKSAVLSVLDCALFVLGAIT